MIDWWANMNLVEQIFWGLAIVSTVLFTIQFGMSLLGLDFEGGDMEIDLDGGGDAPGSIDADFTLFSVRSILAFFTFFSWSGIIILNQGGGTLSAVIAGTLAGTGAMFLVAWMFYQAMKLEEEGNMKIEDAIMAIGKVYLAVPGNRSGSGKIQLTLGGGLREFDAVTDDGLPIQTGVEIQVIDILDNNILLVTSQKQLNT